VRHLGSLNNQEEATVGAVVADAEATSSHALKNQTSLIEKVSPLIKKKGLRKSRPQ